MYGPTWIRVVLWLVFLGVPELAAVPYAPLAVPIALPENLRGKAVWSLARLPDGRLAVGFEGGVALGVPGGTWTTIATPNGSPVQCIAPAHGRVLVVGSSTGFVETGRFEPLTELSAHVTEAHPVSEGWLAAGPGGLWLVTPQATARQLRAATPKSYPSLGRRGAQVFVLEAGPHPLAWRDGALVPATDLPDPRLTECRRLLDGLWFTPGGVLDGQGGALLPPAAANALLDESGLVGAARDNDSITCATFWRGLVSYRIGADTPTWRWDGLGACYTFLRDNEALLIGGSRGACSIESPDTIRHAAFDDADILHLQAEPGGARLVTFRGMVDCGEIPPSPPGTLWPATSGATIIDNTLQLCERAIRLPTRFINGLDVCASATAVAYSNTVLVAPPGTVNHVVASLPSSITSLAADANAFYIGTHADGIRVLGPDGQFREKIGTGRARVRRLGPDRICFLFWDGNVREAALGGTFRLPLGNPRDAALVEVRLADGTRLADQLAVLATRPDKPPVLVWFAGGRWLPLAVPGLAEVDAEMVASSSGHLQVAGRRGVVEIRMPLRPAEPPTATWRWGDGTPSARLVLPREAADTATLTPGGWQPPSAPATTTRLRLANGAWLETRPGVPLSVPVSWGPNEFTLEFERQGLVERRELVVVRPYPWFLRPWALVLEFTALAAALWAVGRWRTRHLLRQKRELEAAVEQRTTELRKANAAKEEFLASVSHEIRNPLNGVVGICAILHDSEIGPRERNFVRVLSGCAEQLRSMLDDVLDFSRIDRGDLSLSPAPFEICALTEEAVRAMDPVLEACTLQLPETPQWLEGDSGKIRQIVCNLVSNALKYGQPREAGIALRLTPEAGLRMTVRLAVHNTGPTIPADELPRLFESFRRGRGTDNTRGFGLGLAVCRKLAERMGGRITAASAAGSTEFALEVSLPMTHPPAAAARTVQPVSRALAIEDEDYNRLALGHALKALGYEVDWAADGASALQLARKHPYDLILTDWKLPDTSGDELCRQLLAILAPPRPPIVAVTAYSSGEKQAAARAAGMAGFLTKPVTREKLEHLIRNIDTGPRPRAALDLTARPGPSPDLRLLGDLAPTLEKLAADLGSSWQNTATQARLHDPRTARAAHALRSLLLLAGESDLSEQFGLLERAAEESDWETVERLLPFLDGEVGETRARLAAGPGA